MSTALPERFAALSHLVPEWAIASGHGRYMKRVNSDMEKLETFYNEIFPFAEEAIAYLDTQDVKTPMSDEVRNLFYLVCTMVTVSLAVELWRQPTVVDSAGILLTRVDSGY